MSHLLEAVRLLAWIEAVCVGGMILAGLWMGILDTQHWRLEALSTMGDLTACIQRADMLEHRPRWDSKRHR